MATPEQIQKIVGPLVAPTGPFTIGRDAKGMCDSQWIGLMLRRSTLLPQGTQDPARILSHCLQGSLGSNFPRLRDSPMDLCGDRSPCPKFRFVDHLEYFSHNLARSLVHHFHLKRGDRVAIAMRNNPEWIFGFLAITMAGGIAVPLNSWWKGKV